MSMFRKFCVIATVFLIFAAVSFVSAVAWDDTQATETTASEEDPQTTDATGAVESAKATDAGETVEGAQAAGDTSSADAAQEVKLDKTMCLACHGSFDDIAAATADYTAPSGETVTPHQYVPHTENPEIPECTECHKPHPIPLESKDQVVKPEKIDWCYATCHHMNNLMPCSGCH